MGKIKLNGIDYGGGSGSGDTVEWTQIEQSGTKIAEIDINGTSQDVYAPSGGGGIDYTLTEQVVGTWLGKPLYQKVVECGTAPAQGQIKSVAHGIADLDKAIELRGFGQRADGMQLFIPNISRGNVYAQTSISVNATNININNGNNSDLNANYTVYMIIQYTKTTD